MGALDKLGFTADELKEIDRYVAVEEVTKVVYAEVAAGTPENAAAFRWRGRNRTPKANSRCWRLPSVTGTDHERALRVDLTRSARRWAVAAI